MALTEKLELLLTADPSQGISALHQLSNEAEKTAKSTTSSLQRIGTAAMKVGVGGIGVGGFLTQIASGDIEAANQLDAAIHQVGQAQADYKDRIDATVSAQAKFGATDEQVSGALTTLTLAYNDTGKALDEMQLAADLAARKHISLGEAATMVAKAHGGAGRLFKEFGIQVQQNADGTKDYDGALTTLSQKLTGQASAAADSWGGKLRELRANAENLVSEFGQNFGPMILGVSTAMTALGGVTSGVAALVGKFRTAQTEATVATEANTVATNSAATVQGLYAEKTGLSKTAVAGGTVAIGLAVVGLYEYGKSLDHATGSVGDFAKLSDQAWDQQTQTVLKLVDTYKGPFAGNIDNIIQHYRNLGPAGVEELQRIRDALAATGGDTSKFDAAIQGATQSERNMGNAAQDTNTKLADQKQRYKDIQTAADDAFTATLKLAPADIRVREGALQISDAKDKQTQAEKDLAAAQASGNQVYIDAAQKALDRANLDYTKTVLDQASAITDLKTEQDAANGVTDDAATKTGNYLGVLGYLNAGLTGPTHDALAGYIWDITVAKNRTDDLRVAANALVGVPIPAPNAQGMVVLGGSPLAREAKAAGGPVMGGRSYMIGERGPELFTPGANGWITPNGQTQGAYTVNIGQIVTADPAAAGDQVARRLRIEAMLSTP